MWDSRAEADRWLRQAENDLEFARLGLREGFFAQVCFLAQQSAEKAVQAVGYLLGERTVLGHSVAVLVDRYSERVPGLADLRDEAGILDQYYIPTRYPNGLPGGFPFMAFNEEQASNALAATERFLRLASELMAAG
ncbi:MAG: HEPN domain-containing protein [Gemmatimonadota bacterium]|nr:HEPN domain-containing protein [Gemmatimonadota bacterium]